MDSLGYTPERDETINVNPEMKWYEFGFDVIPILPSSKTPAVDVESWLKNLSKETIHEYWEKNPTHYVGTILGDNYAVFDAPTNCGAISLMVAEIGSETWFFPDIFIYTQTGEQRMYRIAKDTVI